MAATLPPTGEGLESDAGDWVQHCEGGTTALRGFLRYDADDTTAPPPPPDSSAFSWQPPADQTAGTGTLLYVKSDPGDYIGAGQTYRYTKAEASMSVTANGGRLGLSIDGDQWWYMDVAEPSSYSEIVPDAFLDVRRYPFHNPQKDGFSFSGEGRGCNELTAKFAVGRFPFNRQPAGSP